MPIRNGRIVCGICWSDPRDDGCPNCLYYMNWAPLRADIDKEDALDPSLLEKTRKYDAKHSQPALRGS